MWEVEDVKELQEKFIKIVEDFFKGLLEEEETENGIKHKKSDGESCSHN